MDFAHFMRIERDAGVGSTHTVLHVHDPKFVVELAPDRDAPDKRGKGVIKRVCVPNSWAGDYAQYATFIAKAQEFFHASFAEPVAKTETRRFSA